MQKALEPLSNKVTLPLNPMHSDLTTRSNMYVLTKAVLLGLSKLEKLPVGTLLTYT